MAIQTIKEPGVFIDGIEGYGFNRIQYLTRSVMCSILERFFSKRMPAYRLSINNLDTYSNDDDNNKKTIWVEKEFQYNEQRIPSIIIKLGAMQEKKLYMGADSEVATWISPNNDRGETAYVGAANIPITFAVVTESTDVRREISDLIYICFTHFHRWHYMFEGDDESSFSIVPSQGLVNMGTDQEVAKSNDIKNTLYIKAITTSAYVDYNFFDNLNASKYTLLGNWDIDTSSGVISK